MESTAENQRVPTASSAACQDEISEAKRLLGSSQGKADSHAVVQACKVLEAAVVCHPFEALVWQLLGEAQLISGKVQQAKQSLARSQTLFADQHVGVKPETPMTSWPTAGLPPQCSPSNLRAVDNAYRCLVVRGFGDAQLHFYIAQLCKLQNNFEGFHAWLEHPGITDEYYAQYLSFSSDFFFAHERVWLQLNFFKRVDEMGNVQGKIDRYLPEFYRCVAYEIERAMTGLDDELSKDACSDANISKDCAESLDSPPDAYVRNIDSFSFQLELCLLCLGSLYREIGSIEEAKQCFQSLENEVTTPAHAAVLLIGRAHLELELLNLEKARTLYGLAQVQAAKALATCDREVSPLTLSAIQPLAVQADSFAGMATCDRLLGLLSSAESFAAQALQRDEECGDALRQQCFIFLEQGNIQAAMELFPKLVREAANHSDAGSFRPKYIRFTRMSLDNLNPCPASILRQERLMHDLESHDKMKGDEVWRHLFDLLAQGFQGKCQPLLSDLLLQPVVSAPFPWSSHAEGSHHDSAQYLMARSDWYYERVGLVAEANGRLTAALHILEKEVSPEAAELTLKILWKRHQLFLRRGNVVHALQDLHNSIERMKHGIDYTVSVPKELGKLFFAKAIIHFKLDEFDTSEHLLCLAIQEDPGLSVAKGYLGLIYSKKGMEWNEQALRNFQDYFSDLKLSNMHPDRTMALTYARLLCQVVDEQEQLEAVKMCTHVLSENARDVDACVVRASALSLLKRWEDSCQDFSNAILVGIKDASVAASVYYCRGRAYQQLDRFGDALADFLISKEQGNCSSMLWHNLAFTYEALGSVAEAVTAYGTVIQILGQNQEDASVPLLRRSALYAAGNQYELAIRDLNQLVARQPENIEWLFERGLVHLCQHNESSFQQERRVVGLECALKDFNSVLQLNPHHIQASLKRKLVLSALGYETYEDEPLSSCILAVESGTILDVDPDFLCSHAILLAQEILKSKKSAQDTRLFQFLEFKSQAQMAQISPSMELREIEIRVYSTGMLKARYCNETLGGPVSVFYGDLRTCNAQRKPSCSGHFLFELVLGNKGRKMFLASRTHALREAFFLLQYLYSDLSTDSVPDLSKPLKLLQSAQNRMPNDVVPIFALAVLQERQGQLDTAKQLYISALNQMFHPIQACRVKPKELQSDKKSSGSTHLDIDKGLMSDQGTVLIATDLVEPVRGHHVSNRLRGSICFRIAMMQLKKDEGSPKSQTRIGAVIKTLEYAYRNDESKKEASFFLGWLSLKSGQYEESARWFGVVARQFPDFAEAFNNLGVVEEILGNWAAALRSFRQAESLDPGNHVFKCNSYVLQLRLDANCASEIIEKTNDLIESSKCASTHAYLARGFAYHIRNDVRRDVPDTLSAINNYNEVLQRDPSCYQARILLSHALISRGNLTLSRPHMDWLQSNHPSAMVLPELKFMISKLELIYSGVITDFVFAIMLNPNFRVLHFVNPNVDVGALNFPICCAELDSSLNSNFIPLTREDFADAAANLLAMKNISDAKKAIEELNYESAVQEITKLLAHLNKKSDVYPRALGWRALALSRVSRNVLASLDAGSALRCIGVTFEVDQKLAQVQNQKASGLDILLQSTVPDISVTNVDFAYALLCFLGSLHECEDQTNFELASHCYTMASKLLPNRLEAFMNLANLSRKSKCYESTLVEHLNVLRTMANEEKATGSKFEVLQHKLFHLMSRYHVVWVETIESAITSTFRRDKTAIMTDLEQLQGDLLWICEEFRSVSDQIRPSIQVSNFHKAHKNLTNVADKNIGLLCSCPAIFFEDEARAMSTYLEYVDAVQNVFDTAKPEFGETAIQEEEAYENEVQTFLASIGHITETFRENALNTSAFVRNVLAVNNSSWATDQSHNDIEEEHMLMSLNCMNTHQKISDAPSKKWIPDT